MSSASFTALSASALSEDRNTEWIGYQCCKNILSNIIVQYIQLNVGVCACVVSWVGSCVFGEHLAIIFQLYVPFRWYNLGS